MKFCARKESRVIARSETSAHRAVDMSLVFLLLLSMWLFAPALDAGTASATEISYQGFLEYNGGPANGPFDFEFSLWDAEESGNQIETAIELQDVPVNEGIFQVELDFGAAAFDGSLRWLRIRVALANGSLTTLTPRQRVTAAPMAIHALQTPGGGAGGTLDDAYDSGGPGVGREIIADAGEVNILGPDGLRSDAGFASPTVLLGRPEGFFDIQARHGFTIEGDPPDPAMVGGHILDGNILNPIPRWAYLRVSTFGNHIRRNEGTSLFFQTESAPGILHQYQMELTADGELALGGNPPQSRFHVQGGSDATLSGGGFLMLGPDAQPNLIMDNNEIMARDNGLTSTLFLNNDGGNVAVATNGSGRLGIRTPFPEAPLHITGQPDVSLGGGGGLIIGDTGGRNIGMDGNEIMARDNAQPSTLFLNNDGGTVVTGSNLVVNGTLDIGYEIVHASALGTHFVEVQCPEGKRVLGGGCSQVLSSPLAWSQPANSTTWECAYDDDDWEIHAYAICARVQ